MNLSEGDTVYMKDGTQGTVLHVYKFESAVTVEFELHVLTVPVYQLTKEKPCLE